MRSLVSLHSFHADLDRQMHPDQYAAAQQAAARLMAPAVDPLTLPVAQQAALLLMHESHVKRALITALLADPHDKPRASDFHALCRGGLARYAAGKRLHELTADGVIAAKRLELALCKTFDIHLMQGPSGYGPEVTFSCPCGWRVNVRNSHTAPGNARASFNRHHATQAGMLRLTTALKPPMMVEG